MIRGVSSDAKVEYIKNSTAISQLHLLTSFKCEVINLAITRVVVKVAAA
jgi:hypothetical protein